MLGRFDEGGTGKEEGETGVGGSWRRKNCGFRPIGEGLISLIQSNGCGFIARKS